MTESEKIAVATLTILVEKQAEKLKKRPEFSPGVRDGLLEFQKDLSDARSELNKRIADLDESFKTFRRLDWKLQDLLNGVLK